MLLPYVAGFPTHRGELLSSFFRLAESLTMRYKAEVPSEIGTPTDGKIRVGISGWTYEPWRGTFYPEGLSQKKELEHASRHLTSIEINGTYYGSQKPATYAQWRDETPDDFLFFLKAPRFAMN